MGGFDAPSHWVIVALLAMVLFGYKKLPEMSRSVGRSLRIFKTEMKGLTEDDTARDANDAVPNATPVAAVVVPPAPPVAPAVPPVVGAHSAQPVDLSKLNGEPKASEQMGA
jgi:sec-independent protein translocase protein TatA